MKRKLDLSDDEEPQKKKKAIEIHWSCPKCTFHNLIEIPKCEMCETPNPKAKMKTNSIIEKGGDLLKATEQYICHQCNTTTQGARGLAKVLFKKYPYANVYLPSNRRNRINGKIEVRGNRSQKRVIAMYAQRLPGKYRGSETKAMRQTWFRQCLRQIAALPRIVSIAFPARIGCGLAGGNWSEYKAMINEELVQKIPHLRVVIYDQFFQIQGSTQLLRKNEVQQVCSVQFRHLCYYLLEKFVKIEKFRVT